MAFVRRGVFDTSTLIGAMLLPDSVPRRAFTVALARCELCGSDATLAELQSVIRRAKFDRYLDRATRETFFSLVRAHTRLFAASDDAFAGLARRCRDPRDDKFLALAVACEADAIVSSDDDLVSMNPYQGIVIAGAADFISHIAQSDPPTPGRGHG